MSQHIISHERKTKMENQSPEEKMNLNPKIKEKLEKIMDTLTYREREIIKLRYGLTDGHTYTLETVAKRFKITRERVRQIEARAVRKLQYPTECSHETFNVYLKDQTYFIRGYLVGKKCHGTFMGYEPKESLNEVIESIQANYRTVKEINPNHKISLISDHQHPDFGDPKGLGKSLDEQELLELRRNLEDLM